MPAAQEAPPVTRFSTWHGIPNMPNTWRSQALQLVGGAADGCPLLQGRDGSHIVSLGTSQGAGPLQAGDAAQHLVRGAAQRRRAGSKDALEVGDPEATGCWQERSGMSDRVDLAGDTAPRAKGLTWPWSSPPPAGRRPGGSPSWRGRSRPSAGPLGGGHPQRGRGVREGGVVTRPVGPSAAAVAVHGERRACVAEAGRAHRCQLVRSSPRWRQRPWRWTSPPPAWPGAPPWPWPAAWGASVGGGQRNGWAAAGNRLRKAGWPGGAAVPRPAAGTHSSSSSSGSSASAGRAASSAGRASSVAATQRRLLPTSAAAWLLARHGPHRRPWCRTVDAHGLADRAEKEAIGAALCGHRRVTSSSSTSAFELSPLERLACTHCSSPQCRRPAVAPAPQGLAPRPAS